MSIITNENLYRNHVEILIEKARGRDVEDIPEHPNPFDDRPDDTPETAVIAPNEIDNSDFAWSKDNYLNNPTSGGDIDHECYGWFRQSFSRVTNGVVAASGASFTVPSGTPFKSGYFSETVNFVLLGGKADGSALVGTLTRVSDTEVTLSTASEVALTNAIMWFGDSVAESAAQALKSSSHSLFGANEGADSNIPRWDKTSGWAEIGSNGNKTYDIACPFGINIIRPGTTYYFRVITALRESATANSNELTMCFGVWDETSGRDRFLEAENLNLTVTPVGTVGTTSYTYKVIAVMANGLMIASDEVTVIGADTLSAQDGDYNRLTWDNVKGILDFIIERKIGSNYVEVYRISNGNASYNDYGTGKNESIAGFTDTSGFRAIAYAETKFKVGAENAWGVVEGKIYVPPTYDSATTTGKQWFRIGVTGTMTDVRQVLIDRVMFSLGDGGWNYSLRDRNKIQNQNPSSLPDGSDQGDIGILRCVAGNMPIIIEGKKAIPFNELEKGTYADDGARGLTRCTKVRKSKVDHYFRVTSKNGVTIDCTESERFITSRADKNGTMLKNLAKGDEVLTKYFVQKNGQITDEYVKRDEIEDIERIDEKINVYTPSFQKQKTFVAGFDSTKQQVAGFVLHNLKAEEPEFN